MSQPGIPISRSVSGPVESRALSCQRAAQSYQCELLGQATHGTLHHPEGLGACKAQLSREIWPCLLSFALNEVFIMASVETLNRFVARVEANAHIEAVEELELHLRVARRRVFGDG